MMKRLLILVLFALLVYPTLAEPRLPLPASCNDRTLRLDGYYDRANEHYNAERWLQAVRDYTCVLELDPDYTDAYYWRGFANYDLKEYGRASADMTAYLERVPNNLYALSLLGQADYGLGDYEAAIADYNQILAVSPGDGFALNWRGWVNFMSGDFEQAISDHREAIDAGEGVAYIDLAAAYAQNDQPQEAISAFRSAGDLNEKLSIFYNGSDDSLFTWYTQLYSEALERYPDNFIALMFRGNAHARLGDFDAAIADFTRAITLQPDFPEAHAALGLVYDRLEDSLSALEQYSAYLELSDDPNPLIAARAESLQGA